MRAHFTDERLWSRPTCIAYRGKQQSSLLNQVLDRIVERLNHTQSETMLRPLDDDSEGQRDWAKSLCPMFTAKRNTHAKCFREPAGPERRCELRDYRLGTIQKMSAAFDYSI